MAQLNSRESGFSLRIEDIDFARCKVKHVVGIMEDLDWLGLKWQGEVLFQSKREAVYRDALDQLKSHGLTYPCFCSRAEIMAAAGAPHGDSGPIYPGTCKYLSKNEVQSKIEQGEDHCFRLDMEACLKQGVDVTWEEVEYGRIIGEPQNFGDVVIGQKDSGLSYFLCSTIDDAEQGIELVTRGDDLRSSTVVQRVLQSIMGLPEPEYFHHALVVDDTGKRLAKRFDSLAILTLRESGFSPERVFELALSNLKASPV